MNVHHIAITAALGEVFYTMNIHHMAITATVKENSI
jgi:hypothetical protein